MEMLEAGSDDPKVGDRRIVLRNTMYLGLAEVLVIPLSIFLNALLGRYLGPKDVGYLYLGLTVTKFAFLTVEWGHGGALPAAVVLDKANAGGLLGTSLAWRAAASLIAYGVVTLVSPLLGYNEAQQWVIGLTFLLTAVSTLLSACQDVIRGFERADIAAYSRVGSQFLIVFLVIPVLVLGGRLRVVLLAQSVAVACVLFAVVRSLRALDVGQIRWRRSLFKKLMTDGTPFVFFSFALVFQPSIDAYYLTKWSPADVVGWFAAAQKLVGFLILPATVLIGALYPTLCRLFATDKEGFRRTTRDAIGTVSLLVMPVALCCALYPDVGVSIFGRDAFRPSEDILRMFSLFLIFIYFTMPIGISILASGRQRAWAAIQLCSVLCTVIIDPILIQHFQAQGGNGGVGLALASTISEFVMVGGGLLLMPAGIFDRALAKTLGLAALSALALAATAFALRALPALVAAPIALMVYAAGLVVSGAITREQIAGISDFVRRKLARGRSPAR